MGLKELIAKLKEFIASAEGAGAQMDPDSLAKGKELVGDLDGLENDFIPGGRAPRAPQVRDGRSPSASFPGAKDDELSGLGAELYALIDTMEDKELAAQIKAKIEEARAASGKTADAKGEEPMASTDALPEDVVSMMEAAGLDPADEAAGKAFMAGMKAVSGGANDADPDDETAKDEGGEADKAKGKEEKPLTAQDAAIIRLRAKREATTETKAHIRSLADAARHVRDLCGELDPFAFDSAADIYRHALKSSGRDVTTRDAAALRDMVGMALEARANAAAPLVPSFESREMDGAFAGLNRINIQQ
jgi:hypothetical protein